MEVEKYGPNIPVSHWLLLIPFNSIHVISLANVGCNYRIFIFATEELQDKKYNHLE